MSVAAAAAANGTEATAPQTRTSHRLDSTAAFFAGIPSHAIHDMASFNSSSSSSSSDSAGSGEDACNGTVSKRVLLTISTQGELVHWSHMPGVGYQARALLLPPPATHSMAYAAAAAATAAPAAHRRSHWHPTLCGSSLHSDSPHSGPRLSSASCVASARIAHKDVFVVADGSGCIAQWSVEGDCCICVASLAPFPITSMRIIHAMQQQQQEQQGQAAASVAAAAPASVAAAAPASSTRTYALCASTHSNQVLVVDLLHMHVLRTIDVGSAESAAAYQLEPPSLYAMPPVGVACLELRSTGAADASALSHGEQLLVLSNDGRLSVWDLSMIIRSTLHLSAEAAATAVNQLAAADSSASSAVAFSTNSAAARRRLRVQASSASFFASLPWVDSTHLACISVPHQLLGCAASPVVSIRVCYADTAAAAATAASSASTSAAPLTSLPLLLLVMRHHWIVLDADHYAPLTALHSILEGSTATCDPPPPPPATIQQQQQQQQHQQQPDASAAAGGSMSCLSTLPLPLSPSPVGSRRGSLNAGGDTNAANIQHAEKEPQAQATAAAAATQQHAVECFFLGGCFLSAAALQPAASSDADTCSEPMASVLLWTSCGQAWISQLNLVTAVHHAPIIPLEPHAAAAAAAAAAPLFLPLPVALRASVRPLACLLLPSSADAATATPNPTMCAHLSPSGASVLPPEHFCVYVCSSSSSSSADDATVSLLFGSNTGRLIEFAWPSPSLRSTVLHPPPPSSSPPSSLPPLQQPPPPPHQIAASYSSHFAQSFSTPSFLHRFRSRENRNKQGGARGGAGDEVAVSPVTQHTKTATPNATVPLLHASPLSTCSTLLFDMQSSAASTASSASSGPDSAGFTSLLLLLVQGFDSGRMHFHRILATPPTVGAGQQRSQRAAEPATAAAAPTSAGGGGGGGVNLPSRPSSPSHSSCDSSFHAIQAHHSRLTALLSFQSHQSIFHLPLLVSASLDCTVAVWEGRTGALVFRVRCPVPVVGLTRPRLPPLAPPTTTTTTQQQQQQQQNDGGMGPAAAAAGATHSHSPPRCTDMELVCVFCADHSVRLLSLVSMSWVQTFRGHLSPPRAVFRDPWSAAADVVCVQTEAGELYVWSFSTGALNEIVESGGAECGGMDVLWRMPLNGGGCGAVRPAPGIIHFGAASLHGLRSKSGAALDLPNHMRSMSSTVSGYTGAHHQHQHQHHHHLSASPPPASPQPPYTRTPPPLRTALAPASPAATGGPTTVSDRPQTLSGIIEGPESPPGDRSAQSAAYAAGITPPAHASRPMHPFPVATPVLTPPRLARSGSQPPGMTVGAGSFPPPLSSSSSASPSTPLSAQIESGVKHATWAMHYGLQRLWKMGGKGKHGAEQQQQQSNTAHAVYAHPSPDPAVASSTSASSSSSSSGSSASVVPGLFHSFESLPSLHLGIFSVDIGWINGEMRRNYAPLDAGTTTSSIEQAADANAEEQEEDAVPLSLQTKQRAMVYKQLLQLLVDWNDEEGELVSDDDEEDEEEEEEDEGADPSSSLDPSLRSARSASSSSSAAASSSSSRPGAPGSRLRADSDVLDLLRTKFHMVPPFASHCSQRLRRRGLGAAAGGGKVGSSLPTCYATYSQTNAALTILLPRATSVRATRALLQTAPTASASSSRMRLRRPSYTASEALVHENSGAVLSHLSRWSIGCHFTASQSLCLTAFLLSLLASSDIQLHNYYSLVEAFYNGTLPMLTAHSVQQQTQQQQLQLQHQGSLLHPSSSDPSSHGFVWRYVDADLPFLASYALHEGEDLRRASRLLIQGLIARMHCAQLEAAIAEWGALYEAQGEPPALPWADHSLPASTTAMHGAPPLPGYASTPSSALRALSFPAPPRFVSDFELATCMVLCYLYQAQARKEAAKEAQQQQSQSGVNETSYTPLVSTTTSDDLCALPPSLPDSRRSSTSSDAGGHVISLDASMIAGLGDGLTVQTSPAHHKQQQQQQQQGAAMRQTVAANRKSREEEEQESKCDAESGLQHAQLLSTSDLTLSTLTLSPSSLSPPPPHRTAFILSTLLRLLSQTHADPSLHSIHKTTIAVELLIQGLSLSAGHMRANSSGSSGGGGLIGPDDPSSLNALDAGGDSNDFWLLFPRLTGLEAIYRILFDLSFIQQTNNNATTTTGGTGATPASGGDNNHIPPVAGSSGSSINNGATSFSALCRVLLFEVAKFDLHAFISWTAKEMFGYPPPGQASAHYVGGAGGGGGAAGAGSSAAAAAAGAHGAQANGGDFNGLDIPTAPAQIRKAAAAAASSSSSTAPSPSAAGGGSCALFKALQFDSYRLQLVSMLVSLPRKFPARMSYCLVRHLIDVLMGAIDPLVVAQTRTGNAQGTAAAAAAAAPTPLSFSPAHSNASSPSSSHSATATTPPPSFRVRLQQLVHPSFVFLASKYSFLALSLQTGRLAIADNAAWKEAEQAVRKGWRLEEQTGAGGGGGAGGSGSGGGGSGASNAPSPSVIIYDVHYASKWRTLEGHSGGTCIDALCFSPSGHMLATYCSGDLPSPCVRVWNTDYESTVVGGGFFPARLILKAVFSVTPYCLHVLPLPPLPSAALSRGSSTTSAAAAQQQSSLDRQRLMRESACTPLAAHAALQWQKNVHSLLLTREDRSTATLNF